MIEITKYKPEWKEKFIELNTNWIRSYFKIEEHDTSTFADVEGQVLSGGGEIFFAVSDGQPVGCCALVHHDAANRLGEWELAKMAVDANFRGHGIGSMLMTAFMNEVRQRGIGSVYLEGNTRLEASIAMYRKFGFRPVAMGQQSYERVDIIMRWKR